MFHERLDIDLIRLVKDNPVLYDYNHAKYMDFNAREVAWQMIGDNLKRPPADCKVRWINIRDVHRRILRKNLTQPSRPTKMYKYEKEMAFMRSFYKDVHNTSNLLCEDGDVGEDKSDEWPGNVYNYEEHNIPDGSCSDNSEKPVKKIVVKRRKSKRKRKVSAYVDDEEPSTSFIKQELHESQQATEFDSTDPVDSFLLSIGATLKTFSPYHLNIAKTKIFAIVQEHDLQQIVENGRQDTNDDVKIFD